jgi:hypothetical protein
MPSSQAKSEFNIHMLLLAFHHLLLQRDNYCLRNTYTECETHVVPPADSLVTAPSGLLTTFNAKLTAV